ncbi:type 1 periplasmic-binding domain-containing protein [Flavobacterium rhizosphaerae]|uniref:Type 1 periplasmic binding fold superfamily protein n=1 Tax=Flavobacterium rhizosphaerae TaxID=3163298 RepID=A0ABW8YY42_9FLAO
MRNVKFAAMAALSLITLASCSNDDDSGPVNEEEVITTVTATFTPEAGGNAVILTSRDLDGDGPDAPVVTVSGNFSVGSVYDGTVTFLNEMESPAEDITTEIHEEAVDHQIFFQQNGLGNFVYDDTDANGHPVGLHFTYTAAQNPVSSNLIITLRHLPNKSGQGVPGGDITNAGGGTDAEVIFPVTVE